VPDLRRELAAAQAELVAERQGKWQSLVDLTTEIRDVIADKVTSITTLYMKLREQDADIERLKQQNERAEADAAMLREVIQDVTDVAASRQRVEWRNESEQDAIDAARSALAATPTEALERQRRVQAVVTAAREILVAEVNGDLLSSVPHESLYRLADALAALDAETING
jgi:TolA-binding protein